MDLTKETLRYIREIEHELTDISKIELPPDSSKLFHSLLQYCAANGIENLSKLLLKIGVDASPDTLGWTPLMHSLRHGHRDVAQLLMNCGDSVNSLNSHGADIISVAIASGDLNLVKLLLDKPEKISGNVSCVGHISFVATACTYGYADIVKYLLDRYPNQINVAVQKTGMTPLMLAVAGGHISLVKLLMLHSADTSLKNSVGQTVFDIALSLSNEKIMSLLDVQQPKTPTCCNSDQFTFENHFVSPIINKQTSSKAPTNILLSPCNIFEREPQCLTCFVKRGHENYPLTPNIFLSPRMNERSDGLISMKKLKTNCERGIRKRYRSLDSIYKDNQNQYERSNKENLIEYILRENSLYEVWTLFEEHEVTLRTFLSMDEEDLKDIGIQKDFIIQKLIRLIKHYKRLLPF